MALGLHTRILTIAVVLSGCATGGPVVEPVSAQPRTIAAVPPPAPARAEPAHTHTRDQDLRDAFLVHMRSQAVVLRTASESRTLVAHAEGVLYDPALELLWFRSGDRLSVLDLRKLTAPAVVIARGVPDVNRLEVNRADSSVEREDGCDLPSVSLEWTAEPHLEGSLVDVSEARIVDSDWLRAELQRKPRASGERRSFADPHVRVARAVLDCEEPESCGASVAFGALGSKLVLVQEKSGGDCYQRACLLFEPSTRRFASPLPPYTWTKSASAAARGPCGLYRFDESQTQFLVDHSLCKSSQGCEDLGGQALGWLVSGDTLGEPGLGNFEH